MSRVLAAIGIGSNLGDRARTVERAIAALAELGAVERRSRLYRTQPWGGVPQPDFCNAVALVSTGLSARALLHALKRLEQRLGRRPGERWAPRSIDLDVLTYGNERIVSEDLVVPHPRLGERAFALVPLGEVDGAFAAAAAAALAAAPGAVVPWERSEPVRFMPDEVLVDRVRTLAQAFLETDLMRLRIEEASSDAVEFRRSRVAAAPALAESAHAGGIPPEPVRADAIRADLVGIFRFTRPVVSEGDRLEDDREIGYVEALGIRNPVRSFGGGRIAAVHCHDGDPVEYGQVLVEIERA